MGIESTFDHLAVITRNAKETTLASEGRTNFSFDRGDGSEPEDTGVSIVISSYPCRISESVGYQTGPEGEKYTGRVAMKGLLTDLIQEGDLVDSKYKVVGDPVTVHHQYTHCNLVRLG